MHIYTCVVRIKHALPQNSRLLFNISRNFYRYTSAKQLAQVFKQFYTHASRQPDQLTNRSANSVEPRPPPRGSIRSNHLSSEIARFNVRLPFFVFQEVRFLNGNSCTLGHRLFAFIVSDQFYSCVSEYSANHIELLRSMRTVWLASESWRNNFVLKVKEYFMK